ncbi:hypothetical protein [Kitasatospora sp. NPDC004289]
MDAALAALAPRLQLAQPGTTVPVLPALAELLPARGLQPGQVVSVTGGGTALVLALAAAATVAGSWTATAGFESLGLVAAAEIGLDLEHLVVVEGAGERWPEVVTALADGVAVLLLRTDGRVRPQVAERLVTVTRKAGCALVVAGEWPGARVQLGVIARSWEGVGQGRGRLKARRLTVRTGGRGGAARERDVQLWLPHADGSIRTVEPDRQHGGGRSAAGAVRGPLAVV